MRILAGSVTSLTPAEEHLYLVKSLVVHTSSHKNISKESVFYYINHTKSTEEEKKRENVE